MFLANDCDKNEYFVVIQAFNVDGSFEVILLCPLYRFEANASLISKVNGFPWPAQFHAMPRNSDKCCGTAESALCHGIPLYWV